MNFEEDKIEEQIVKKIFSLIKEERNDDTIKRNVKILLANEVKNENK